jgi:mannose-1-phosphate guanylyltransferase
LAARTVIKQPENRGTGVAIGAAILMLRSLDAEAIVVGLPCDHHYTNEGAFVDGIEAGIAAAKNSYVIVLIGAEANYPETEYGWIEPVQALASSTRFPAARSVSFGRSRILQPPRTSCDAAVFGTRS